MLFDKTGLLYEPFLILVHDLRLVLMILCEQHSFLSYKLHASFLHLPILILSHKNGKSSCKPCKILGYLTSTSRIYPFLLSSSYFFMNSLVNFDVFFSI